MIISASRRTDIPAFFAEWFMNRIREGFVCIRNPFNQRQVSQVSLSPDAVDCIVFWTKNPVNLFPYLDELSVYNCYFQFSLTPYDNQLEPGLPPKPFLMEIFKELSRKLGKKKVIWRYDPIIITDDMPVEFHKGAFAAMADALRGHTERCVISFLDMYKKCEKNLKAVRPLSITADMMRETAKSFADIALRNEIEIVTCAEEIDLNSLGITHGKCIDDQLISEISGRSIHLPKDKTQRTLCDCVASVDIGGYNTCAHGCLYCYANSNGKIVKKNLAQHDPLSAFLIGKE